jgi:hypothetical protein
VRPDSDRETAPEKIRQEAIKKEKKEEEEEVLKKQEKKRKEQQRRRSENVRSVADNEGPDRFARG